MVGGKLAGSSHLYKDDSSAVQNLLTPTRNPITMQNTTSTLNPITMQNITPILNPITIDTVNVFFTNSIV